MDGYQNLVSLAMNPNCVVVILISRQNVCWVLRGARGCKLNIYVFADSSGDHAFFLVTDFEVRSLWWQNVQPLRSRRIVDYSHFKSMGFISFKTCKFNYRGRCLKNSIGADGIKGIVGSYGIHSDTLASVN